MAQIAEVAATRALVLDANILLRGVLGTRVRALIERYADGLSWIEVQLAHADRNKVGSAYNHARYLPQRRTMMQAWGDYIDSLRAQSSVTVCHQVGEQAALTAIEAFQHVDSNCALSFQAQAMDTLHAIVALSKRH